MQAVQFQVHFEYENRHWWFLARRTILRRLVAAVVPPSKDAIVIDYGCGTGGNLAALADEYECVGVDASSEALTIARATYPSVQFLCTGRPEDLEFVAGKAKVFLLTDVLEHVADDFDFLSRLMTLASPGAYFLVTVPAEQALWSRHDESHGHYRRYERERFTRLWQGLPVEPLLVSPFNARLYPVVRAVRTWNRWRGRTFGKAYTDLHLPPRSVNDLLRRVFESEGDRLLAALGNGGPAFRRGVSWLAVLQRQPGRVPRLSKPADIEPDAFNPRAESFAGGRA